MYLADEYKWETISCARCENCDTRYRRYLLFHMSASGDPNTQFSKLKQDLEFLILGVLLDVEHSRDVFSRIPRSNPEKKKSYLIKVKKIVVVLSQQMDIECYEQFCSNTLIYLPLCGLQTSWKKFCFWHVPRNKYGCRSFFFFFTIFTKNTFWLSYQLKAIFEALTSLKSAYFMYLGFKGFLV